LSTRRRAAREEKHDDDEPDLQRHPRELIGEEPSDQFDPVGERLEEPLLRIRRHHRARFMAPDRPTVPGQQRRRLRVAGRRDPGEDVVAAADLIDDPILQSEHVGEASVDARSRRSDGGQRRIDALDHGWWRRRPKSVVACGRPGGAHPLELLHLLLERRRPSGERVAPRDEPRTHHSPQIGQVPERVRRRERRERLRGTDETSLDPRVGGAELSLDVLDVRIRRTLGGHSQEDGGLLRPLRDLRDPDGRHRGRRLLSRVRRAQRRRRRRRGRRRRA
jgi:hypothetical protein